MIDIGFTVASLAFFALAMLYIAGCERLQTKVSK